MAFNQSEVISITKLVTRCLCSLRLSALESAHVHIKREHLLGYRESSLKKVRLLVEALEES